MIASERLKGQSEFYVDIVYIVSHLPHRLHAVYKDTTNRPFLITIVKRHLSIPPVKPKHIPAAN